MSIVWSGLAPHPPVIVDPVGKEMCRRASTTIASMKSLAVRLVQSNPDRVVVISPHTPRPASGVASWCGETLSGDFRPFGASGVGVVVQNDRFWIGCFEAELGSLTHLDGQPMDHGALVPLWFLAEAGWKGPTCVIGLPWYDDGLLDEMGECLARASDAVGGRTALLASGDMSHCLASEGTVAHNPKGQVFDQGFVDAIRGGNFQRALEWPLDISEEACQDVLESCRVTWNATKFNHQNHVFLSYEDPFGVGYCVTQFHEV